MSTTETQVPPLRQSIFDQMACEHSYGLVHVRGLKPPDTLESTRGTDIHAILAPYAAHCARERIEADYAFLDSMLESATEEVAGIIETCRDHMVIDWANFYGAEIMMGLDEDFQPTWSYDHDGNKIPIAPIWDTPGSGNEPRYALIADEILVMPGGLVAVVEDYKSHPRAFKADTFQGKLYSLATFMHMPSLQEITFRLKFVRYANVVEEHTYYRSDVPDMMAACKRMRLRQIELHQRAQAGEHLTAHGGKHCTYCPCILDPVKIPCPIYELNPMTNLAPAVRLNWRMVHEHMSRENNKAMKQFVDGTGQTIESTDANGRLYTFGAVLKKKTSYPLFSLPDETGKWTTPIIDALQDWFETKPEDLVPKRAGQKPWFLNLQISSTKLNQYLKAKSRELVHSNIADLAETQDVTKVQITRAAEVNDGTGEEYREYGDDE